jgi:hypothetical protein
MFGNAVTVIRQQERGLPTRALLNQPGPIALCSIERREAIMSWLVFDGS